MELPSTDDVKSTLQSGMDRVQPLAKKAADIGRDAVKTKIGRTIAIGAAAGGAIAYALPLISITTGLILGGGITAFWKNLETKD